MKEQGKRPTFLYFVLTLCVVWAVVMTCAVTIFWGSITSLYNSHIQLNKRLDDLEDRFYTMRDEIHQTQEQVYFQANVVCDNSAEEEKEEPVTLQAKEEAKTVASYVFEDSYERDIVERVVMAESGNQELEGQKAVAQCILNTALHENKSAAEVVLHPGQYASPYDGEVTDSVKEAVRAVFDRGEKATDEPIMYFYAYKYSYSRWHENSPNLEYACTIGAHKFFKLKEN